MHISIPTPRYDILKESKDVTSKNILKIFKHIHQLHFIIILASIYTSKSNAWIQSTHIYTHTVAVSEILIILDNTENQS